MRYVLVAIAIGAISACYPKAGPPPNALSPNAVTWASSRFPGTTAETLAHGRELFVGKCNACHDLPDVTAVADDRWPGIVKTMGGKAHLGPEDRDALLHFVLAARSEQTH